MRTSSDQLAELLGTELDKQKFGLDFGFDVGWDIEPGPHGPRYVHEAVFTLPSPLGGDLLGVVLTISDRVTTAGDAHDLVAAATSALRSQARGQLSRAAAPPEPHVTGKVTLPRLGVGAQLISGARWQKPEPGK